MTDPSISQFLEVAERLRDLLATQDPVEAKVILGWVQEGGLEALKLELVPQLQRLTTLPERKSLKAIVAERHSELRMNEVYEALSSLQDEEEEESPQIFDTDEDGEFIAAYLAGAGFIPAQVQAYGADVKKAIDTAQSWLQALREKKPVGKGYVETGAYHVDEAFLSGLLTREYSTELSEADVAQLKGRIGQVVAFDQYIRDFGYSDSRKHYFPGLSTNSRGEYGLTDDGTAPDNRLGLAHYLAGTGLTPAAFAKDPDLHSKTVLKWIAASQPEGINAFLQAL